MHVVTLFGFAVEHDVVKLINAFMPDAEFGTHTVVTRCGGKHFRFRSLKRGQQLRQTLLFFMQLLLVEGI